MLNFAHSRMLTCAAVVLAGTACTVAENPSTVTPQGPPPTVEGWRAVDVFTGLNRPWSIDWLPDGRALITEKDGRLSIGDMQSGRLQPVSGVPTVFSGVQGGLMEVSVSPNFAEDRRIFLTLSEGNNRSNRTVLVRATLDGTQLRDVSTIFRVSQFKEGSQHFGSRILWLPDGTMLLAIGDGGNPPVRLDGRLIRENAQDLNNHLGKVLRLTKDGTAPADNPFAGRAGALPEIWSYGHRNIQGMARDPETGRIFVNEHGARGGDEVNVLERGGNFGWPLATFSTEYWGPPISPNTTLPGMIDPIAVWTPATGPSGLAFYTGDRYPEWRGSLFSGGLASRDIRRLVLDADGKVVRQERMQVGQRVRDVRQGPDGYLYVLTDETNGRVFRIELSR